MVFSFFLAFHQYCDGFPFFPVFLSFRGGRGGVGDYAIPCHRQVRSNSEKHEKQKHDKYIEKRRNTKWNTEQKQETIINTMVFYLFLRASLLS